MPYVIYAQDKPDHGHVRENVRPTHLDYLREHASLLLAGGALLDDDGKPYGSMLVIDSDDRSEVEQFAANDPFTKAGLFAEVSVSAWRKAFFDKTDLT